MVHEASARVSVIEQVIEGEKTHKATWDALLSKMYDMDAHHD